MTKSFKVLTTMLMKMIVQRKCYTFKQYSSAIVLSIGLYMFLLNGKFIRPSDSTLLEPACLALAFLAFDAFTSNWQDRTFRSFPQLNHREMMANCNSWSLILSFLPLIPSMVTGLPKILMVEPALVAHIFLLACSSAIGQLFIFQTLAWFGAVVLASVMSARQVSSALLSCLIYGHSIDRIGLVGAVLIFVGGLMVAKTAR
ncbi:hypothetical protein ACOME3_002980 [Neoechinorhynchus agilis]